MQFKIYYTSKKTTKKIRKKMELKIYQLSDFENNSKRIDFFIALKNMNCKHLEVLVFRIKVSNDEIEDAFNRKLIGAEIKSFSVPRGINEVREIKWHFKTYFNTKQKTDSVVKSIAMETLNTLHSNE